MYPELDKIVVSCQAVDDQLNSNTATINSLNEVVVALQKEVEDLKNAPKPPTISFSGLANVIPLLNQRNDWIQPSNAGDTGGSDPTKPNGTFTFTPGAVGVFSAQGGYPYNNGYWYIKTKDISTNRAILMLDVMYPDAEAVIASQAIEFELQMSLNGFVYNMAWQCPVRSAGFWRTFDYTNRKWVATNLESTTFTPGKWYSIAAEFSLDTINHTTMHVGLTINGIPYVIGVTRAATPKVQSNYLSVGFQLDSNSKNPPTPYKVSVRNMHIIY